MADVLIDARGGVLDPLPTVANRINAFLDRAAKADEKAESYRVSAGQELAKARERVDAGEAGEITWTAWCADNIKRSEGDIRKVLAIANAADPAKAAAAERQRNREAAARHRADVSAVKQRPEGRSDDGITDVTEPKAVTVDTVMQDILQLGPNAPRHLIERLIPLLRAEDDRAALATQLLASDALPSAKQIGPSSCSRVEEDEPTAADDPGAWSKPKPNPGQQPDECITTDGTEHQEPDPADPPSPTLLRTARAPEGHEPLGAGAAPDLSAPSRSASETSPIMRAWETLPKMTKANLPRWLHHGSRRGERAPVGTPQSFIDLWITATEPQRKSLLAALMRLENSRWYESPLPPRPETPRDEGHPPASSDSTRPLSKAA